MRYDTADARTLIGDLVRRGRAGRLGADGQAAQSRSAAAVSVSVRFGNAKRTLLRPSSGREKNDEPGTAGDAGSRIEAQRERDVVLAVAARSAMSVMT